jgi:energy-coupling factor transporter ATP-binding protein EcfA2
MEDGDSSLRESVADALSAATCHLIAAEGALSAAERALEHEHALRLQAQAMHYRASASAADRRLAVGVQAYEDLRSNLMRALGSAATEDPLAIEPSRLASRPPELVRVGVIRPDLPALLPLGALGSFRIRIPFAIGDSAFKAHLVDVRRAGDLVSDVILRVVEAMRPGLVQVVLADTVLSGTTFSHLLSGTSPGDLTRLDTLCPFGRVLTTGEAVGRLLSALRDDMEKTHQTHIFGQGDLESANRQSLLPRPWRLLALIAKAQDLSEASRRDLSALLNHGLPAGFLVMLVEVAGSLPAGPGGHSLVLDPRNRVWTYPQMKDSKVVLDPVLPRNRVRDRIVAAAEAHRQARRPVRGLRELLPERLWSSEAAPVDGAIQATVGVSEQGLPFRLRFNETTAAHGLVVGPNGSGKSTLLTALVCSLATEYSPADLEVYLLDFKEGIEFGSYAPGHLTSRGLPHARVVTLKADQRYALSVVEHLLSVVEHRARVLKRSSSAWGVPLGKRADYLNEGAARGDLPEPMPAVLLLIDEFQNMFPDAGRESLRAVDRLERLLRISRSLGIHVLLCSQTLSTGPQASRLPASGVQQLGVRVCFRMPGVEAASVLRSDNTASNYLAPFHAVYNAAAGDPVGNTVFLPARLSPADLVPLLNRLASQVEVMHPSVPQAVVFDAEAEWEPSDWEGLAGQLGRPVSGQTPSNIPLVLGLPASMPAAIEVSPALENAPGGHLLLAGAEPAVAQGTIVSALLSVAAADPSGEVILIRSPAARGSRVHSLLAECLGARADVVDSEDLPALLDWAVNFASHRESKESSDRLVLAGWGLDGLRDLLVRDLRADETQPWGQLTWLLQSGPAKGVHLVLGFNSTTVALDVFGARLLPHFGIRALSRPDDGSHSLSLLGDSSAARSSGNRLFVASHKWAEPLALVPARLHIDVPIEGGALSAETLRQEEAWLRDLPRQDSGPARSRWSAARVDSGRRWRAGREKSQAPPTAPPDRSAAAAALELARSLGSMRDG